MAGNIKVLAGDFKEGRDSAFISKKFVMKTKGKLLRETIPLSELDSIEQASEKDLVNVGSAAKFGIIGTILFGIPGLILGALFGGKGGKITWKCQFKDGRKFVATSSLKIFNKINAHVLVR